MKPNFTVKSYAKAILVGEHAVIRGGKAIILPVNKFWTELNYNSSNTNKWHIFGSNNLPKFNSFVDFIKAQYGEIKGDITIKINCPPESGLGSSATIAVCIAKLLFFINKITSNEIYESARLLENFFHGNSSGADIVCVIQTSPIIFSNNPTKIEAINIPNKLNLLLWDTNKRFSTKEAVNKVTVQNDAESDKLMTDAVDTIINAIKQPNIKQIANGMNQACKCFKNWDLLQNIEQDILYLKNKGAIAVKPTGGGNGGHLISLWNQIPDEILAQGILI